MADAYVTRDQFDEFVKRIEQAFAYAEKARAQELALINQRFELVDKRFEQLDNRLDGLRAEIQGVRNWMIGLFSPLVLALVAAIIKWIFFPPTP